MKLSEIKEGELFTIGNTPSYPKLRTARGWVDVRDRIWMTREEAPADCRLMTVGEAATNVEVGDALIEERIAELKSDSHYAR